MVEVKANTLEALGISKACKYILDVQEAREKAKQELILEHAREEAEILERVRERTSMLEISDHRLSARHSKRMAWVTVLVGIGTTLLGALGASITSHIFRK